MFASPGLPTLMPNPPAKCGLEEEEMKRLIAGGFLVAALVALGVLTISSASAKIRLDDGGQLPFYARIEHNEVFHSDEWAVLVFYRSPACVPEGFNLLDQFHFPSESDAGAFECQPPTVEGFALWDEGPGIDDAPTQVKLHGLGAVPVWFVSWKDSDTGAPGFETAIADGVLTVSELEGLHLFQKGTATSYTETIHPFQSNRNGMIQFAGKGTLDASGQPFFVQALFNFASGGLKEIQIQLK
jgi:hypothetical protein